MTSPLPRVLRWATFVAIAVVAAPLIALLWRVPWSDLPQLLSTEVVVDALLLSTLSSMCAAGAALVLGTLIALQLSNMRGAAASTLRALVNLPMVLPPVVGGAALLFAFGRNGLIGETNPSVSELSEMAKELQSEGFRMYWTDNLAKAKSYIMNRYEGMKDKRYGLIASSRDKALAPMIPNDFQ